MALDRHKHETLTGHHVTIMLLSDLVGHFSCLKISKSHILKNRVYNTIYSIQHVAQIYSVSH